MWGLVWEGCREGVREGTAASSEQNGAGAAREGNAAMGKWHGEDQHACFPCYNTTSPPSPLAAFCRRHCRILDATAAHSLTYLGRVVGAQSFFGHGFFDARAPQRGSMDYTGTAYSEEWAREAAVHGHGKWSMAFYIPSRTRKSDLRARLAMSNGRLRLEPSDAGSCFRVGNTKRWISDVDGGIGHWTGHGPTGVGACAWCTAWRHQSIPRYAINFGRGLTRCLENTSNGQGL